MGKGTENQTEKIPNDLDDIEKLAKELRSQWTPIQCAQYADALYDFFAQYLTQMIRKDPKTLSLGFYINGIIAKSKDHLKTETRKKIVGENENN